MDNLVGKLIRLRSLQDSDYDYIATLRNDLRTQAWNQRLPPCFTPQMIKEHLEERFKKENRGVFGIETREGKLVGYLNYHEDSPRFAATVGLSTGIGYWGKGYAKESMELILRFLYEERGVQVVRLWTWSGNERMIGLAKKLGFMTSATLRESSILKGKTFDTLMMDMLREEFYESRGLKEEIDISRK